VKSKIHYAVAAILSSASIGAFAAQPAKDAGNAGDLPASSPAIATVVESNQDAESSSDGSQGLAEIVVTATRRSENIQHVPITIQALTGSMLTELHISSFDDYVRMVPNLTAADNGPGQNEIIMRGVSAGTQATQSSGIVGFWPNVAVYLDNQSVQLPGQNLDIYMVDMNRIEALEGPQGTLFGAGAEAGAIRYITNEPKLNTVEGSSSADYSFTAHGDPNTAVNGVLNLPLIQDRMAVRLVAYTDRQGGYIDNVPGTFTRHDTDLGIHYANYPAVSGHCPDGGPNGGYCVPPGSPVANNSAQVRSRMNPVTYQGGRVEAAYQFNENWSVLLSQMYQSLDADGVFYQFPNAPDGAALNPLEVVLFTPAYHSDRDSNTAWTLKGKAGPLSLIYTGGYLSRTLETQADYTNYARGVYGDYYQCYGPNEGGTASLASTCFSPVGPVKESLQNRVWQHELRAQTPESWRLRGIAGIYEQDNAIRERTAYYNESIPPCTSNASSGSPGNTGCMSNVGTFPGATAQVPGIQAAGIDFDSDAVRETKQIAEFASVSFDLTQRLTLTAGTRHFIFLNNLAGSTLSAFGCFEAGTPVGGCHNPAFSTNLTAQNLSDTESGWRSQANVSWHIDPMLFGNRQYLLTYFTFSQGFRPGGFNQNSGATHGPGTDGVPQYIIPRAYHPDTLNNYEVGWKTNWHIANRYFQWNTAFYRQDWKNAQIAFFDPGFTGTVFFDANGQNFRINGIETSLIAQIWRGLKFQMAGAWNSSSQTNSPVFFDNNPASANFGKPITQLCSALGTNCGPLINPFGPRGAPTADSPPIRLTFLLRYDFPINAAAVFNYLRDAEGHLQVGIQHQGHSFTQAGSNPPFVPGVTVGTARIRFEDPAYTTLDASAGILNGHWSLAVYAQNLTNSNAVIFTSTDQFIVAQTPVRPRVIGVRFGYTF
jgi:iron complex outermembrane receptor protein